MDKDASVTLAFGSDGHLEGAAVGSLTVTQDGCQPKGGVERVAMSQQARAVVGKISQGAKGIVQGGVVVAREVPTVSSRPQDHDSLTVAAAPGQIRPILGSTVLSTNPVFSWPTVPKAKKYTNDPAVYGALSELCWQAGREEDARRAEEKAAELEKKTEEGKGKAERSRQ